jgi:GNAT superfamily N-acetyltransferase
MTPEWRVRVAGEGDYEVWTPLFRGYCDFYNWPTSEEHQRQIWDWILVDKSIEALLALEVDGVGDEIGVPRGMAHLRQWVRPLRGAICGYLDDLFVDPEWRGTGAVEALFTEINRLALERHWAVVRWTTAVDNLRAQGAYDKIATRTSWVTYDMTPRPGAPPRR